MILHRVAGDMPEAWVIGRYLIRNIHSSLLLVERVGKGQIVYGNPVKATQRDVRRLIRRIFEVTKIEEV